MVPETDRLTGKREQADAVLAALNARDFEALSRMPWDPEMEFRSALAAAEGTAFRGKDALHKWAREVDAIWDDMRTDLVEFHEVDEDRAVVVLRLTGTAKASGVPLDSRVGQVWSWREGMLWRNVVFTDPREAFDSVGLA